MHHRNPYLKKKPDFAELGSKHPFLAPYVTAVKGKGHVDFKNKDALRALTRAILLEDFGLDLIIPADSLVPIIPQRLNYILWIEDLFKLSKEQLRGLDVGTGSTAIYALLCARKNKWNMVATDIVKESIEFAKKNIERNGLTQLVKAHLTHGTSTGNMFSQVQGKFHFSMCNPPFFSSEEDANSLGKSRNPTRPSPSGAKTGRASELVAPGGELQFLTTMITESKQFADTVGIFTTMVGIKADLKFLTEVLREQNVLSYASTKFVQGKTMRWGLAWTFDPNYAPLPSSPKPTNNASVRAAFSCRCPAGEFFLNIKSLLSELQFEFLVSTTELIEVANEQNTWSNQRRKRRAAMRNRDSLQEPLPKRPASLYDTSSPSNSEFKSRVVDSDEKNFTVHFEMALSPRRAEDEKEVLLKYVGGSLGTDAMHQVVQYLKNAYTKHACLVSTDDGSIHNLK